MKFEVIHEVWPPGEQPYLEQCATFAVNHDGKLTFEMKADNAFCQAALETAERDGGIQAMVPESPDLLDDYIACAIVIKFVPTTDEWFPAALAYTLKALVHPA